MPKAITPSLLLLLVALISKVAGAQDQRDDLKNRYQNIEVLSFNVAAGIDLPSEYMRTMMVDVVDDLKHIKKFRQVVAPGEGSTNNEAPTVQLLGTVTQYKHGSRGKRFIALGLAGDTKVVAHVKFVDKVTSKVLVEADVDGQVYTGLLGGSPKGAPSGVGKDIAKIAKKVFF